MTREEKELIVKVIASATDKVPTETFAKLTRYFFEPRSCESCKHLYNTDKSFKFCNEIGMNIGYKTAKKFYCSEWESKQ